MSSAGPSLSLSLRVAAFAGALCASALALEPGPALRLAVSPPRQADPACAEAANAGRSVSLALAEALADSLRARGTEAVADTVLARWLGRLDGRFPDPRDYGRTREYIASTGARRLVYVNDLRRTEGCGLRFEAALWDTEPLARRASESGSAGSLPEAAGRLARWMQGLDTRP